MTASLRPVWGPAPGALVRQDEQVSDIARPSSLDDYYIGDWDVWVLGNGLPERPSAVDGDESVRVAYWRLGGVRTRLTRPSSSACSPSPLPPAAVVDTVARPSRCRPGHRPCATSTAW